MIYRTWKINPDGSVLVSIINDETGYKGGFLINDPEHDKVTTYFSALEASASTPSEDKEGG